MSASTKKLVADFAAAEDELDRRLTELRAVRRQCRDGGYLDQELCTRGEQLYDQAAIARDRAEALFQQLTELHRIHWKAELERELDTAHETLLPLVRAWRISSGAFEGAADFRLWAGTRLSSERVSAIVRRVLDEPTGDVPLEPPRSHLLELADEELLC